MVGYHFSLMDVVADQYKDIVIFDYDTSNKVLRDHLLDVIGPIEAKGGLTFEKDRLKEA